MESRLQNLSQEQVTEIVGLGNQILIGNNYAHDTIRPLQQNVNPTQSPLPIIAPQNFYGFPPVSANHPLVFPCYPPFSFYPGPFQNGLNQGDTAFMQQASRLNLVQQQSVYQPRIHHMQSAVPPNQQYPIHQVHQPYHSAYVPQGASYVSNEYLAAGRNLPWAEVLNDPNIIDGDMELNDQENELNEEALSEICESMDTNEKA
jgi:hypothetical protein